MSWETPQIVTIDSAASVESFSRWYQIEITATSTDSSYDGACMIHDLARVPAVDLGWSCHCQTCGRGVDSGLTLEEVEFTIVGLERTSMLLCDELP